MKWKDWRTCDMEDEDDEQAYRVENGYHYKDQYLKLARKEGFKS